MHLEDIILLGHSTKLFLTNAFTSKRIPSKETEAATKIPTDTKPQIKTH